MRMPTYFDDIATVYDRTFTHSATGRLQRDVVHQYLSHTLPRDPLKILEVNCGTGEDAIFMAARGHHVLATDASGEMLEVARSKISDLSERISFEQMELPEAGELQKKAPFDLIFSNFGGLNCLDPKDLSRLNELFEGLLVSKGRFIAVIMPPFCLWETAFYLRKFNLRRALRRLRPSGINFEKDTTLRVHYYSPARIQELFPDFRCQKLIPVGLFIPPSYLENWLLNNRQLAARLSSWESSLRNYSAFAGISDHYLIDLKLS